MAIPGVITAQTGGREFDSPDILKYSGFVGGVNATHHALKNYSPLMDGFGRLFMVRGPKAIQKMFAGKSDIYSPDSLFTQVKHMFEYMHRSVTGFGDKELEVAGTAVQGGFAGRQFRVPTVTKEKTESITIGVYEFTGSPFYTVIDGWMNAIGDENSGLATYGGWVSGGKNSEGLEKRLYMREGEEDDGIPFNEANHTCEFIWVIHDRTGSQVERAVLLADCYPTSLPQAKVLNMDDNPSHDIVTYDITFNCVAYRSPIITSIANDLLKQYRIVSNSYNFNPQLGDAVYAPGDASLFNRALGSIPSDSATGTNVGNIPAYNQTSNINKTKVVDPKSISDGKLAGQETRSEEYFPDDVFASAAGKSI